MAPQSRKPFALKPAVYGAAIDDDLVLLDAQVGAYHCLAGAGPALRPDGRTLAGLDPALAAALATAGLAAPLEGPTTPRPPPPRPRATALRSAYPPPTPRDLPEAAFGHLELLRRYRGRTFAQILAAARDPMPTVRRQPAPLADVLDRFQGWIPYGPVSGKCLLRSFLLLRLLRRQGHDAMWVFGVTTWPFAAHCWLQVEDLVLDDELDRIAAYTPIMVR